MNRRNPKNILVTGGAGFMGSDFILYMLEDGGFSGKIVNLDLLTYAANPKTLNPVEKDRRYQFVRGDICNRELLRALFEEYKFDAVVHFAAESHVDRSIEEPHTFIETNVIGTHALLEVVRRSPDCHFHLISTDEVYGDLPRIGLFTESSPYNPSSPYSASKAASDLLTLSYGRTFGISVVVSHATNNFGPTQHSEKLIPKMIRLTMKEKPIPLYGNGENIRQWLYVRDHSEAIKHLLYRGKSREIYNIAGKVEKSNLEVVMAIFEEVAKHKGFSKSDPKRLIQYVEDRPGHDFRYALDGAKMEHEINWKPRISFEEGLAKTVKEILDEA